MKKNGFTQAHSFSAWLILLVLLTFTCRDFTHAELPPQGAMSESYPMLPDAEIRNIIFFIGDGMGLGQVTAGRIFRHGVQDRLHLERMPVTGIIYTHAADKLITDSAASGTALASGVKTRNGMIGMNADSVAVVTILQLAQKAGKSTGLVSTSSITHATPASFATHVDHRKKEAEIAEQLVRSGVDVMLGAGLRFFVPSDVAESRREDDRNLLKEAADAGYTVVQSREDLLKHKKGKILGLFHNSSLQNEPPEPTLAELTTSALQNLQQNKKGFFLMVEGSQIDWAAHDNDLDYMLREMLSFDDAIKVGLDFALKDKHTLVVVTADHETGGITIEGGSMEGGSIEVDWTTGGHSGIPVPVYAFGPHSLKFTGVYDNTRIPKIFAQLWKFDNFPRILDQKAGE